MKTLALYCALLALPLSASAQKVQPRLAGDAIKVENMKVERANNVMIVDMSLDMTDLKMPSNKKYVFTPVVKNSKGEVREMPQLVINGRKRDIIFQRGAYRQYQDNVSVVRRKNGTAQKAHYQAMLPYEDWMQNCDVEIAQNLCGCNDKTLDQDLVLLKKFRQPMLPYLRPQATNEPKVYNLSGSAFIDFPVNKFELHPNYRRNPVELQKIIDTINVVKADKYATITRVEIHGYASPESPYSHNAYLAENRARTLKNYVRDLVALSDRTFAVTSTPEDWAGLRRYVAESNIENREAILSIIDDKTLEPDPKEWKIKTQYPKQYRYMLDNWYPALRHSDYVVTATVKSFTDINEAKEAFKTRPQHLSLNEMFLVAQTYEPGSQEFNNVMETAAQIYPASPVANINAALSRMETCDLAGARHYLQKAGNGADALHARGVLAILEGNNEEAVSLLKQAAQAGSKGAQENLDLLDN